MGQKKQARLDLSPAVISPLQSRLAQAFSLPDSFAKNSAAGTKAVCSFSVVIVGEVLDKSIDSRFFKRHQL